MVLDICQLPEILCQVLVYINYVIIHINYSSHSHRAFSESHWYLEYITVAVT